MVKGRRALITAAGLVVLVGALWFWQQPGTPVASSSAAPARGSGPEVPWIHLDRLKSPNPAVGLGRRNIFGYGVTAPPPVEYTEAPPEIYTPPPITMPPGPTPTPAPPPLTLKFMGVAQPEGGKKIALLLTEQKEILHGREGDVLAGRYRIVKIGLESVEVEEVTTGQKQSIAIGGRR
jgi:hypothetical protein